MSETCHGDVLLASTNLIKDKQPEIQVMISTPGCWCHCIRSKTESNLLMAIKNRHRLRDWDTGAVVNMEIWTQLATARTDKH